MKNKSTSARQRNIMAGYVKRKPLGRGMSKTSTMGRRSRPAAGSRLSTKTRRPVAKGSLGKRY